MAKWDKSITTMGIIMEGFNKQFFKQSISEDVWRESYKWETDESIYNTFIRNAKDLASIEKQEIRETVYNKYLELFLNNKYVPGGRVISNAGTGLKGTTYINCFVSGFDSKVKDSIEGIYREVTRQAKILKSEGGYGFCIDTLRPRGSYIHGTGGKSPGPVKILELWDKSSEVITSGAEIKESTKQKGKKKNRKGAQMVTMSVWNPSIEEFILAKQTSGVLTKFNMSSMCTDEFMEAVINDKPWQLVYPKLDDEHYDEEWDGNLDKWISKGYPIDVYKEYASARELWELIMTSTYKRNEPGVIFIGRVNKLNNLYYCEIIDASNPCLVGDTIIRTTDGDKTIKDIVADFDKGIKNFVYTLNHETNVVEVEQVVLAQKTKEYAEVIEIELEDGQLLKCTPDHRIFTKNRGYVEAKDLTENDELVILIN